MLLNQNSSLDELSNRKIKNCTLQEIDHIEFYVTDAYESAIFYKSSLGFNIIAYGNKQTGLNDKVSYIVEQGSIRFIFSSCLNIESSLYKHVLAHDNGVKNIAFLSSNIEADYDKAVKHGVQIVLEPTQVESQDLKTKIASVTCFGDTIHTFIQRERNKEWRMPFYKPFQDNKLKIDAGLVGIDHIAIALEKGQLNTWEEFYHNAFNFQQTHREDVYTEYSGMNSLVMSNPKGTIKFPLVEPASSDRKSQIDSYLESYGGAGVQHIAFLSEDIIKTTQVLKNNGIEFLTIPNSYYDNAYQSLPDAYKQKLPILKDLGILVDTDQKGVLMQIFSKPLQSRPTFFIEIIQRDNIQGFGSNNIKALFEAIERDQLSN
ncbi:MAG: 4-hydroxyphenylpyruvate dioxygenase [Alphaproteobacteria bacterium]|nr:4-hydroxyphenylpyruvate dioxygenase [Alphaproteobacteria bacterium]